MFGRESFGIVASGARGLAALVVLLALAGCGGGPKPTLLELTVSAAADINPDAAGRGSPVVLTLYQLKSTAAFEAVDYFQLADGADNALGDTLIASEQVVVAPGQELKLPRELDPAAQHVGVTAAFQAIDRAQWRASAPVSVGAENPMVASLTGLALSLEAAK